MATRNGRPDSGAASESLRIDRLLFFLRFAKSRSLAQKWVEEGYMRLNGVRVATAHQGVKVGDVLTLPSPKGARVVTLLTLPHRRGPASEAQACYCETIA